MASKLSPLVNTPLYTFHKDLQSISNGVSFWGGVLLWKNTAIQHKSTNCVANVCTPDQKNFRESVGNSFLLCCRAFSFNLPYSFGSFLALVWLSPSVLRSILWFCPHSVGYNSVRTSHPRREPPSLPAFHHSPSDDWAYTEQLCFAGTVEGGTPERVSSKVVSLIGLAFFLLPSL